MSLPGQNILALVSLIWSLSFAPEVSAVSEHLSIDLSPEQSFPLAELTQDGCAAQVRKTSLFQHESFEVYQDFYSGGWMEEV